MKAKLKKLGFTSGKLVKVSLVFLLLLPSISFGDDLRVTIILSSNSNTYITTANHIKSAVRETGNDASKIKIIEIHNLHDNKSILASNTDIFIPIGQNALMETLKYSGNNPVLASLISKNDFNNIIHRKNNSEKQTNIGAIYIDQPLKRHLQFSRLALPNVDQFGFILSEGNKHTIDGLYSLQDSDTHRIEIINPGDNVIGSLSRILNDAQVIIALPDPIVFNLRTTRRILLSTYRKRVPVIGFSKSYVKAGALAAIYSTPESIGKQTGEIISRFIKQDSLKSESFVLPRLHAKYFSISVNDKVSRSLGLSIMNKENLKKEILQIEKIGVNKPVVKP